VSVHGRSCFGCCATSIDLLRRRDRREVDVRRGQSRVVLHVVRRERDRVLDAVEALALGRTGAPRRRAEHDRRADRLYGDGGQ
jgi:hypothetical protein